MSASPLGLFGKYLSLWVSLCIIVGIMLGNIFPFLFLSIANLQYQNVNFCCCYINLANDLPYDGSN